LQYIKLWQLKNIPPKVCRTHKHTVGASLFHCQGNAPRAKSAQLRTALYSHKMPSRGSRVKTNAAAESLLMKAEAEVLRKKARKLDINSQQLLENLSEEDVQRGREMLGGIKAKLEHKNAAYRWLKESNKRTQAEARELLAKGTLPGVERLKVNISQSSFSKFCGKMDSGQMPKERKGRPQILCEETCQYITRLLRMASNKNKCQLYVQIATIMRTVLVLKEGIMKLEELDELCRVSSLERGKGRRHRADASKRKRRRNSEHENDDESDSSESDTDGEGEPVAESDFKRAMSELFAHNSKGIRFVKAGEFAWPSIKTVRSYAKRYQWGIRKGQQQDSWRFDAANPEDIAEFFESLKRTRSMFSITTAEQIHNGDELRLSAEFQQTGELVEVMVANGAEHCRESHAGRKSGSKSINGRLIKGLTFFNAISMAEPDHVTIIRQGAPNKQKEEDLQEACKSLEEAGIAYDVLSTESGYQDAESYEKCMMYFMRSLHKREAAQGKGGIGFDWINPQKPTWQEIPPLVRFHEFQIDNASCHSMDDLHLRANLLLRGVVLQPLFTNTTDTCAALDQHCHKIMKLFVRKDLLICFELEISGGIRNQAHAMLLAAGMHTTISTMQFPKCCKMSLATEMDVAARSLWLKLNQLLTMNNNVGEKWTDVRLAKIACPSLAAGLKYCKAAFLAVGQGGENATDLNIDKVLQQPIMVGGREIWETRKKHSELELKELHAAAAKVTGCIPDIQKDLRVVVPISGDRTNDEDGRIMQILWGENPPAQAWAIVEMVRRAKELNQLEDRMNKARQNHQRRAPVPMHILRERMNVEDQVQSLSRNAYMEAKHPTVLKAFSDVVVMCDTIKKALEQILGKKTELQGQRLAAGIKPAKWNRDKDAVVACMMKMINGVQVDGAQRKRSVKSLADKMDACIQEEIAAIQRKDKFKAKCEEMLIPVQNICEKMTDLDAAASVTRQAIQALNAIKDVFLAELAVLEALPAL
jgi:hypothetical protein